MSSQATSARRGYAMITVLWVMAAAAVVTLAGVLAGRFSIDTSRNRIHAQQAFWIAAGCARNAQSAVDAALGSASTPADADLVWRTAGRVVRSSGHRTETACDLKLEAAGTRIDVNTAPDDVVLAALTINGASDEAAHSMLQSLRDWRDTDDVALPDGAERDWYAAAGRPLPRNGALADDRELRFVRGFEEFASRDSLFTVEPGRISLATAPVSVLRAVPGFTEETADLIASLHDAGMPVANALEVLDRLSVESRDAFTQRFSDIVRLTTSDPDAWIMTVRASTGSPPATVEIRWRLVRNGRRCVAVQARSTP